jgi:hypothetical protein
MFSIGTSRPVERRAPWGRKLHACDAGIVIGSRIPTTEHNQIHNEMGDPCDSDE